MIAQTYRSYFLLILSTCLLGIYPTASAAEQGVVTTTEQINRQSVLVTIRLPIPAGAYVPYDSINFSVSNSAVALSAWQTNISAIDQYDLNFKKNMRIFDKNVVFTTQATIANTPEDNRVVSEATIDFSYRLDRVGVLGDTRTIIIPLKFSPQLVTEASTNPVTPQSPTSTDSYTVAGTPQPPTQTPTTTTKTWSLSGGLSSLIETTDSVWVRALLVLLLGILLSLTPCIYPMIPITAGILQSHGNKSVAYNFLLSCCYVAGIATTFAILGLIAASTGQMIGSFTSTPWFMLCMAGLLAYMAGSMFGWYELYTPSFLKSGNRTFGGNACVSAFLFGTLSGSIASPCVSPGLILVLGLVTTLGSKLLGFLFLFLFGIGLGFPLLLVGTFSSSINMLPRAGAWMLEIKKLVGFMLLGTSLYFIRALISPVLFAVLATSLMVAVALSFFISARATHAFLGRWIKNCTGTALVASALLFVTQTYRVLYLTPAHSTLWETNYQEAYARAQQEHKLLFIDIGSPFCTLCTAIDNKTLAKPDVCSTLSKCVCVKVDSSDTTNTATVALQKKYAIVGVPAFLLIDPKTGDVRKRWSGELYNTPPTEFIETIEQIVASEPVHAEAAIMHAPQKTEVVA